jgi:hypothetical protein
MREWAVLAGAFVLVAFSVAQADETLKVQRPESPAGTIARGTVGGALGGVAVSGLLIGWQVGIQNNGNHDWGRTLGIGAVVGASLGLVWGLVDAASGPGRATQVPLAPVRDGYSETLDVRKKDRSRQVRIGIFSMHF